MPLRFESSSGLLRIDEDAAGRAAEVAQELQDLGVVADWAKAHLGVVMNPFQREVLRRVEERERLDAIARSAGIEPEFRAHLEVIRSWSRLWPLSNETTHMALDRALAGQPARLPDGTVLVVET